MDDLGLIGVAFNPYECDGGGVNPAGHINLDSGSFNPEQITKQYGRKAGKVWAKAPLRDRWDALVAHEDTERRHDGDHYAAVEHAPETDLANKRWREGDFEGDAEGLAENIESWITDGS